MWPFRKRRAAIEDWKPGDLAECIHFGRWQFSRAVVDHPSFGEIRAVGEVTLANPFADGRAVYLRFARWPGVYFHASCFRKLPPPRPDELVAAGPHFIRDVLKVPQTPGPTLLRPDSAGGSEASPAAVPSGGGNRGALQAVNGLERRACPELAGGRSWPRLHEGLANL